MNESILIVEDDTGISRFITLELQHDGYQTSTLADGKEALSLALSRHFDLIILDIMLPGMNGIEVLTRLRSKKNTPVIVLTARDRIMDKVSLLDLGASDYMIKPFDMQELLARIRANLRKTIPPSPLINLDRLTVNCDTRAVTVDCENISLTKKEFDLLVYLLQNRGRILSRDEIVGSVWGFDFLGNTNLVDVYIRYLRAKIEDRFEMRFIKTVRGSGYMIKA